MFYKAANTLCGSQNGHSEALQGYHTLCGSENGLSETAARFAVIFYKAAPRIAEVKTDWRKLYKVAESFPKFKTDSPKLNKIATSFA